MLPPHRPLLFLGILAACGGDEPGTKTTTVPGEDIVVVETQEFDVELRVLLPTNEPALFSDIVTLDLRVDDDSGEVGTWSFTDFASGDVLSADELGALSAATVTLLGHDEDGTLIALGTSDPISIEEGSGTVSLLLSRVDDFGWLNAFAKGLAGTAAAGDGQGRLLVFGGSENVENSSAIDAQSSIWAWSPQELGDGLSFVEIGAFPEPTRASDIWGHTGHSATRLGGTHDNQDLILVAGGATGYRNSSTVSDSVVLWDPASDTARETSLALPTRRFHHEATADGSGNVVISGGLGHYSSAGTFTNTTSIDILSGASLAFDSISVAGEDHQYLFHGAAQWGDRGVLLCGGVDFGEGGSYPPHAKCGLVSPSGVYTDMDTLGIELPEPRFHHAMVGLEDGRVLVTGGATWSESGGFEVTDTAWVLDANGTSWTDVGPLHKARAQHRMARLPDGRVAVVGGTHSLATWFFSSADALACAEIFTPGRDDFREVPPCLATDETGALPRAAIRPALAVERAVGLLAVGGVGREDAASTGAALYVPRPDDAQ